MPDTQNFAAADMRYLSGTFNRLIGYATIRKVTDRSCDQQLKCWFRECGTPDPTPEQMDDLTAAMLGLRDSLNLFLSEYPKTQGVP